MIRRDAVERKRGRPAARGGRCGGHSLVLTADRGQVRAPRFASPSDVKLLRRPRKSNRPTGPSFKATKKLRDTMTAWSNVFSLRRRAGTAPESSAPSRRSSGCSTCTGRRSTYGSRSSTTRTSCASSRSAARLRRERDRGAGGRDESSVSAHGVAPSVYANAEARKLKTDRRDLPARHEGARRGQAVRRRRLHRRPDRTCRPRGGRRDDGRGARGDRARAVGRGCGGARGPRSRPRRLHHADDALRRRDRRDHRRAQAPLPATRGRPSGTTSVTRPRTGSGP